MATHAHITLPAVAHTALLHAANRMPSTNEDALATIVTASIDAFDAAMSVRVESITDVRTKLSLMMAESGGGLVEIENVAIIARDIDELLGRTMQ